MSEKFYVGERLVDFRDIKRDKPISKITLLWDEEHGVSAGTDNGLELTAECYFATAAIAEKVRAALDGYEYHAFSAVGADIDPAAEPGDGITACGVYSTLVRFSDDGSGYPDIEAPGEAELEEEYPMEGPLTQQIKQKVTLGTDYEGVRLTRTNGLEVVNTLEDGSERARAHLKSSLLAFYDDNGAEALYFDPRIKRYVFRGDVVIDGNIRMGAGQITWTDGGIDSGISAWEAQTIIDRTLVSSPNIAGGKFWDLDPDNPGASAYLEMYQMDDAAAGFLGYFYKQFSEQTPVFEVGCLTYLTDVGAEYGCIFRSFGEEWISYTQGGYTRPLGTWDFGSANVTGMYLQYA